MSDFTSLDELMHIFLHITWLHLNVYLYELDLVSLRIISRSSLENQALLRELCSALGLDLGGLHDRRAPKKDPDICDRSALPHWVCLKIHHRLASVM